MAKTKHIHGTALYIAHETIERIELYCHRIEVAGSLRRNVPIVGDIELVAVPCIDLDLLGDPLKETQLDRVLNSWDKRGKIFIVKNGPKYKQFTMITMRGIHFQVDLFLQPDPATWEINFMIRTGPAEFSKKMVTRKSQGGYMPDKYRVSGGRVKELKRTLETPEESDVFNLWEMDYIEPEMRKV